MKGQIIIKYYKSWKILMIWKKLILKMMVNRVLLKIINNGTNQNMSNKVSHNIYKNQMRLHKSYKIRNLLNGLKILN